MIIFHNHNYDKNKKLKMICYQYNYEACFCGDEPLFQISIDECYVAHIEFIAFDDKYELTVQCWKNDDEKRIFLEMYNSCEKNIDITVDYTNLLLINNGVDNILINAIIKTSQDVIEYLNKMNLRYYNCMIGYCIWCCHYHNQFTNYNEYVAYIASKSVIDSKFILRRETVVYEHGGNYLL
jgi:hypothetical protein